MRTNDTRVHANRYTVINEQPHYTRHCDSALCVVLYGRWQPYHVWPNRLIMPDVARPGLCGVQLSHVMPFDTASRATWVVDGAIVRIVWSALPHTHYWRDACIGVCLLWLLEGV